MIEKIIKFKNINSKFLYGVVHIPRELKYKYVVNILNPGLKSRVAPHRFNVKLARKLCNEGFFVFRLDPEGIGDSEGNIGEKAVVDIWGDIQKGKFVNDFLLTNNKIGDEFGFTKFIFIGSCGGAITSLLCANKSDSIVGQVLLDIPSLIDSSEKKYIFSEKIEDKEMANSILSHYIQKIKNPKSLLRFLTGKSDFSTIIKILLIKLNIKKKNKKSIPLPSDFNMNILEFVKTNTRPVLFLLSSNYFGTRDFNKYLKNLFCINKKIYKIFEIKNSNHIYSFPGNLEEIYSLIFQFLKEFNKHI